MTLVVNEIFSSLQGESSRAGLPCSFVRLTGCNLRCRWCDSRYAYEEGRERAVSDIVDEIRRFPPRLVEITGGEPLLQQETPDLCRTLLDLGMLVMLETNGSLPIDRVPAGVIRIIDIKCPESGEAEAMDFTNLDRLDGEDEVKFVVACKTDFDYARAICLRYDLLDRCEVLIAPVYGQLEPARLAQWIIDTGLPLRLQLPLHKILWGPDRKGV